MSAALALRTWSAIQAGTQRHAGRQTGRSGWHGYCSILIKNQCRFTDRNASTAKQRGRPGRRRPHRHGAVSRAGAFFCFALFRWRRDDRSAENQTLPPQRAAGRRRRRRGHLARPAQRRLGRGLGQAREGGSQDRLHSADRLRQRGDGLGAGHRQEVRRQDHPQQGSQLGRRARQAGQRRTGFRARAVRPDLRRAHGHGRPEEGHGRPDEPEQQRPGHHAVQEDRRQGRGRRRRRWPS